MMERTESNGKHRALSKLIESKHNVLLLYFLSKDIMTFLIWLLDFANLYLILWSPIFHLQRIRKCENHFNVDMKMVDYNSIKVKFMSELLR